MEDVLDLYAQPYDSKRPSVCFDETNKQLIKETRTPLPAQTGQVERYDYEYERNGTANLFMMVEPLAGQRFVAVTEQRTKIDFAHQMKHLVDVLYPEAEVIRVVLDNLNTHTKAALYEAFEAQEARRIVQKLEFHYTPKHGSWLNMAEIELAVLDKQCLSRRIPDQPTLCQEVAAWQAARNHQQAKINWCFNVTKARAKLKRLYPSTSQG
jgi:transposase